MKRIGLICMALVIALGALGVGYAMWWDDVIIQGTVNTGTVEIEIVDVSETWVYKDLTTGAIVMSREKLEDSNLMYVASATSEDVTDYAADGPKTVQMTFDNIFPTATPIYADVVLHYIGSIPVHVVIEEKVDPSIAPYLIQQWYVLDVDQWVAVELEDLQLHFCNRVMLWVYLDAELLQAAGKQAQDLSGTFTKVIHFHQWNEDWPAPTPP